MLADEADRVTTLEILQLAWQRAVQVEARVRAESVQAFDRGNVAVTLSVTATVTYASQALALASVNTFGGLFAGSIDFKLEQNASAIYFPGAVCQGYQPQLIGVTVRHSITFISEQSTTNEP